MIQPNFNPPKHLNIRHKLTAKPHSQFDNVKGVMC